MVYLSDKTSRVRLREAENARQNRLEIVQALSQGHITKRDLFKWGIFTTAGLLAAKNGLSPFARSAYAAVPTGTPRSPLYGAQKFTQPMPRQVIAPRIPMQMVNGEAVWGASYANEKACRKSSYHTAFNGGDTTYRNPVTLRGPCEGRPPAQTAGDFFAHQRWEELPPKVGFCLSIAQVKSNSRFHPAMAEQNANSVWCFGSRTNGQAGNAAGLRIGSPVPTLVKARYGEPILTRIYNDLPVDRAANGGFGRNEISTHFHNAHNGAESDGACNAYHFPGTFYDYHWGTTLARRDMPSRWLTSDPKYALKASGPDDSDGLVQVPGDFRELQGTMWFHDHRFFFTAENVHKGMFAMCNYYSGPDRGSELPDRYGVNLQLPSGSQLAWGNTDFDVNLAISNPATDQQGQLYFDIFDTDGFLGDMLLVNGAYAPFMEVLPRRYRFRTLNASMARFIQLALVVNRSSRFAPNTPVPFHFIANDGNFVVSPIKLTQLDVQGVAERYDIVVDFSAFKPGDTIRLVNVLKQTDGRLPAGAVSIAQAIAGVSDDPAVGPLLEFRVVNQLQSVDNPGKTYDATKDPDRSTNLDSADWTSRRKTLTTQIPIVAPVRERVIEFGRSGGGDSRVNGQCIPECGDITQFPWSVKINGQAAHSLNATRIGALIPRPNEVEHWTLVNGGGGWDHPIHLHFEEGVTIDRPGGTIPVTEKLVRKDVWRLKPSGKVKFQVTFGEFGGSYVSHCHNTIHEDFAMLLRYQLLAPAGQLLSQVTKTPIPSPDGITWKDSEVLPEADPKNQQFFPRNGGA